jgi:histidine triad (HIT) family protein
MSDSSSEPDPDCLFCRFVSGDLKTDVVLETDTTLAFRDIEPQAPTHVLVVPKAHQPDAAALASAAPPVLADLFITAEKVARKEGLERGYRLVLNTGPDAQQSVFHVHCHVIGGRQMGWPPG